jgi:hypothetical protein
MTWLDLVDRAEAIRAVFMEAEPSLDAVRLHEVVFHQDGPTVTLRFDLAEFPAIPPPKWLKAKHNTVQMKLALDVVSEVKLEGWTRNNVGKIELRPRWPKGFVVEFGSNSSKLMVICDFVRIDSISAYCDSVKKR